MKTRIKKQLLKIRSQLLLKKRKSTDIRSSHIIGFAVVKDEVHLIKKTIEHYRSIGCDRFVLLDNGSTDGTCDYLLSQPDICVYTTSERFQYRPNGMSSKKRWMSILLNKYGLNHWCIGFDADELLMYPNSEQVPLSSVIDYMQQHKFNALKCQWIDMYSDKPITQTTFDSHTLLEDCHYFDQACKHKSAVERVFNWRSEFDKTPLFKWSADVDIENGWHRLHGAVRYADFKGLSLHFPFHKKLIEKAKQQAASGQYYLGGAKYKRFYELFRQDQRVSLHHDASIRFTSTEAMYTDNFIECSENAKQWLGMITASQTA